MQSEGVLLSTFNTFACTFEINTSYRSKKDFNGIPVLHFLQYGTGFYSTSCEALIRKLPGTRRRGKVTEPFEFLAQMRDKNQGGGATDRRRRIRSGGGSAGGSAGGGSAGGGSAPEEDPLRRRIRYRLSLKGIPTGIPYRKCL